MKRIVAFLLVGTLLFLLGACEKHGAASEPTDADVMEESVSDIPRLILNGEELDVYTMHYMLKEEYAVVPLSAFLSSIGAKYASSSLNEYGTQCYSFEGKRYVIVGDMHLFMLVRDYRAFLKELDKEGKELSRETAADRGLLPKNESNVSLDIINGTVTYWGDIWIDHISLMNALNESGVDITIEYDYSTRTINVTLP